MADEHSTIIWPLRTVAVDNTVVFTPSAHLLLDRANSEFGVIQYTEPGVAVLATFSSNDEPIYFAVAKALGACSRFSSTCKKVCVQTEGSQLDFEFVSSDDAADFVKQMGMLVTKVHNTHFEFYEASR
jgi:histone acetyltransferase HTATIP